MPDKEHKTRNRMIAKTPEKSRRIATRASKAKHVKIKNVKNILKKPVKRPVKKTVIEKTLKKKIEKKAIKKSQKNVKKQNIPPVPAIQSTPIATPIPTTQSAPEVQNLPSVTSNYCIPIIPKTNLLAILFFLSIILFFVGGYFYPATSEDMASNNVIWAGNDGKYDRGLFSQFYASIAFTFGVILLGYYVNATFIRFNIKYWNYFLIGILLMFFFGLGKIGELIFNHNIFEGFKNLILPVALMILAFASYKIYKNMVGGI